VLLLGVFQSPACHLACQCNRRRGGQGCQIFLGTTYQNGGEVCQMTIHKIHQVTTKRSMYGRT
jgi:hypothetical protein